MRTLDEQLGLIRGKAAKRLQRRRRLLRSGAAEAAGLLLAAALGVFLPRPESALAMPGGVGFGSIVLSSPVLNYVVIAVLSFILGILITLLCISHRARPGMPEKGNEKSEEGL